MVCGKWGLGVWEIKVCEKWGDRVWGIKLWG